MPAGDAASQAVVVFDIDDTLYLERDYVRSGFRAVGIWAREALGVVGLGERAWAAFESGVRRTIFDDALASLGIEPTPSLLARLVACYRDHSPDIRLLDDARACLDALAAAGAQLAVVSDGPLASQSAKARCLGLDAWSETVILTDTLGPGRGKPHPHAFELVQKRFGATGERCVYVADNPAKDFAAPHALGWQTIRVRRPDGLHHAAPAGDDVDHEIPDLGAVIGLVSRRTRRTPY